MLEYFRSTCLTHSLICSSKRIQTEFLTFPIQFCWFSWWLLISSHLWAYEFGILPFWLSQWNFKCMCKILLKFRKRLSLLKIVNPMKFLNKIINYYPNKNAFCMCLHYFNNECRLFFVWARKRRKSCMPPGQQSHVSCRC